MWMSFFYLNMIFLTMNVIFLNLNMTFLFLKWLFLIWVWLFKILIWLFFSLKVKMGRQLWQSIWIKWKFTAETEKNYIKTLNFYQQNLYVESYEDVWNLSTKLGLIQNICPLLHYTKAHHVCHTEYYDHMTL